MRSAKEYIEHKPISSFPKSVIDEIDLLSVDPKYPSIPFGSSIYRIQQYPGDVDLLEEIYRTGKGKKDEEKILNEFIKSFKQVLKRVISSKLHYFSEIKAGLDDRYDLDIGTLINGKYTMGKLFLLQLKYLREHNLIRDADYKIIMTVKDGTTANDYDIIYNIIRNYRVLRWSPNEIVANKKKVLGKTINLYDTLKQDALFKIDEIALVQNRFIEVTDVYFLFITKDGEIVHGHQSELKPTVGGLGHYGDFAVRLKVDMEKLYYSDMFYSPFKMLKRAFALAQAPINRNDPQYKSLIIKLVPFISSPTSMIYQIKSQLEAILVILENSKSVPIANINTQIDEIKFRIPALLEIRKEKLVEMNDLIDEIVAANRSEKIDLIKELMKQIKRYINYTTILFMERVGLNPPPVFLMPEIRSYNKNLVRSAYIDPINPLKLLEQGHKTGAAMPINDPHLALKNLILHNYSVIR